MSFSFLGTAAALPFVLWRFGGWHAVTLGCLVLLYALTYKSVEVESVNG
jgi:hypothetical protein